MVKVSPEMVRHATSEESMTWKSLTEDLATAQALLGERADFIATPPPVVSARADGEELDEEDEGLEGTDPIRPGPETEEMPEEVLSHDSWIMRDGLYVRKHRVPRRALYHPAEQSGPPLGSLRSIRVTKIIPTDDHRDAGIEESTLTDDWARGEDACR